MNKIEDSSKIHVGQRLFIPHAKTVHKEEITPPVQKKEVVNENDHFFEFWPLKNVNRNSVTKRYGRVFDPDLNIFTNNNGIGITAIEKNIISVKEGNVKYIDFVKGLGNMIGIEVDLNYYVFYYPCRDILIKKGERVEKAQIIAKVEGDILNFEIRRNKFPLNPLLFLP